MSAAGGADAGDAPLPPDGSVLSSNLDRLEKNTHLFFDDDVKYIAPVQTVANGVPDLKLQTVYCQIPREFVLHNKSGNSNIITNSKEFRTAKLSGLQDSPFKSWLSDLKPESSVGTGLTVDVIHALLEREIQSDNRCMYFFDFDQTLTYVKSLNFDFRKVPGNKMPENFYQQYARYIYSDFCGEEPEPEPEHGRLRLLQRLFEMIGPERIYIVTSNEMACPQMTKTDGTLGSTNPYLPHFIQLIRQLLPVFNPEHLISTCQKNCTSRYPSKEAAITDIIKKKQSGGGLKTRSSSHKKKYSRRVSKQTKYRRHRHRRTTRKHRK